MGDPDEGWMQWSARVRADIEYQKKMEVPRYPGGYWSNEKFVPLPPKDQRKPDQFGTNPENWA